MKMIRRQIFSIAVGFLVLAVCLAAIASYIWKDPSSGLHRMLAAAAGLTASSVVATGDNSLSLGLNPTDNSISSVTVGTKVLPLLPQQGSVTVTELNNKPLRTQYTVGYSGGSFTTPVQAGGTSVSVQETYTSGADYLRLDAVVSSAEELPLQVTYTLPVSADGWTWHDTLRSSRPIHLGGTYSYLSNEAGGAPVTTSVYPLGTISNGTNALTVAIPMDAPRLYTISYTPTGLAISFAVATSPDAKKLQGKAAVSLVFYSSDGTQGMRGALAKYYSIFPQFFTDRIPAAQHGSWNRAGTYSLKFVGADPGVYVRNGVPDVSWALDYGYGMKNNSGGPSGVVNTWSDAAGTLSNIYRQDWVFNAFASNTYNAAVEEMKNIAAKNNTETTSLQAQAALSATAKNSDGSYSRETYIDHIQFHENTEVPAWRDFVTDQVKQNIASIQTSTTGHPDALHMDSWSGIFRWNASFDYDRSHWAYASLPLVPTFSSGKVGVAELLAFPNYIYLSRDFAALAHSAGLYVSSNTNTTERRALSWLGSDVIDFFGIESSLAKKGTAAGSTLDSYAIWKRAIAYQRPVSTLEDDFQTISPKGLRAVLNQNLFYDIYAAGDPQGSANNTVVPAMWTAASRAIFKQYTPLFKTLSGAGWEPVTYVSSSNSAVWVERYGSLATENLYLAVRNETDSENVTTLTLTPGLGVHTDAPYILHDIVGLKTKDVRVDATHISESFTVPARTTLVFSVSEYTPPAPVLSLTAESSTLPYNGTTTLRWTSSNTVFCVASGPAGGNTFARVGTSSSYVVSMRGLTGTATYTLACRGVDTGTTTATTTVVIGPAPDTSAPLVAVSSPERSNIQVSGIITLAASSTDNRSVAGVQFSVDGVPVGSEDITPPFELPWDTTTVADGSHIIVATARDTSGNMRASGPRIVRAFNSVVAPTSKGLRYPSCALTASSTVFANAVFPVVWAATNTTSAVLKLGDSIIQSNVALPTATTTLTAPSVPGLYTYILSLAGTSGLAGTCARNIIVRAALPTPIEKTTPLAVPSASPAPGKYTAPVDVVLTAKNADSIRYTQDGTAPSCANSARYAKPIHLTESATLKAIACPPDVQAVAGQGMFARIATFFKTLVAAVGAVITGTPQYTQSTVATFVYTITIPPGTNAYAPRGYIDLPNQAGQSCEIGGWTCDPDNLAQNLNVEFYEGSARLGSVQTNFSRVPAADVAAACGAVQNADGTFTKNYTPAKGFRAVLTLPTGTHWVEAYALDIDSAGKQTGTKTALGHGGTYRSIVCDPSIMTGTLLNTTVVK